MEVVKASFVFINDTPDKSSASALLKRKAVRAQAARQQPLVIKNQNNQPVKSAAKWNKYQARKRNRHQTTRNTFAVSLDGLVQQPEVEDEKKPIDHSPEKENATTAYLTPAKSKSSSSETSSECIQSSRDQLPSLSPPASGMGFGYPFVQLSCGSLPYVGVLMNHYLTNLATDIPELDAGNRGILRSRWYPMVLTADATFNIVLLTAASHFAVFNNLIGNQKIKETLLYLKCQTYAAVNLLIRNSSSEIHSDALIGAVAKLASYEAMFGSPELYHLHIRNLQIMINQRGGLDTLGLDGLLQRMVLWIDINSAFLLNSTAYFLPKVPLAGHVIIQQPNPSGFLGKF